MRINQNIAALNTYRQLSSNSISGQKSIEKLSSGIRINRAGDDAAGLAISEKMRAQIKGLNQASRNAQDGISMIQTAEGALSETHDILQRMRELAVQSANSTNVTIDRSEIQKEINQLTSEINRIGNTTEFNTQKLLKGDGSVSVDKTGLFTGTNLGSGRVSMDQAAVTVTVTGTSIVSDRLADSMSITLNGHTITVQLADATAPVVDIATGTVANITATGATYYCSSGQTLAQITAGFADAFNKVILNNSDLVGNFTASNSGATVSWQATSTGAFKGANGNIAARTQDTFGAATLANIGTTTNVQAYATMALAAASAADVLSEGITINGTQLEFYDANKGQYTGEAVGMNVAGAANATDIVSAIVEQVGTKVNGVTLTTEATSASMVITASTGGLVGNDISYADGGIKTDYTSKFQIGASEGQSFQINIADMRSRALGVAANAGTDGFTSAMTVTDGTSSINKESAVDVSTHEAAAASITKINAAIEKVSSQRSSLGSYQNRLEHSIRNLDTSSENLTAAESRIRDVDMAKEMMTFTKNNILTQAAQAMLAQANQAPQGVLQLLR